MNHLEKPISTRKRYRRMLKGLHGALVFTDIINSFVLETQSLLGNNKSVNEEKAQQRSPAVLCLLRSCRQTAHSVSPEP